MPNSLPDEIVERITAAIFAGRKIEAIKLYRAATNSGLKEAKEFIEGVEARLRVESPERFTAAPNGCSRSAAVLLAVAATIYFLARGLLG